MRRAALFLSLVLAAGACASGPDSPSSADALPAQELAVTLGELRHHVEFLAADELRGRAAGSPEAQRAARYLARALARAGVEPAGDDGGFLQAMTLVREEHLEAPELVVRDVRGNTHTGVFGRDFSVAIRGEARSSAALRVRTARSAEELPELEDPGEALFLDGSLRERRAWLSARGMGDGSAWGLRLRSGSKRPGRPALGPRIRRPRLASDLRAEEGCETVTLRGTLAEMLEAGELRSVELRFHLRREELQDYNVIGRIRGVGREGRPELAAQALVISAHYDHLGVRRASAEEGEEADLVYNGADDDASGTAGVLEIAEALAAGAPPARTLVFLLAAGEEIGLVGTRYYLDHPAVALDDTLLNLNLEMIGRPDAKAGGVGKLWMTGFEETRLGAELCARGVEIAADPYPRRRFHQRSDHAAFVRRGVMGHSLSSYDLHEDYHRVSDEVHKLDWEHLTGAVRSALAAIRLLAAGELDPAWLEAADADG